MRKRSSGPGDDGAVFNPLLLTNSQVGPSRFERESPAPQAGRIPSYPTGPMRKMIGRGASVRRDLVDRVCVSQYHPAATVTLELQRVQDVLGRLAHLDPLYELVVCAPYDPATC